MLNSSSKPRSSKSLLTSLRSSSVHVFRRWVSAAQKRAAHPLLDSYQSEERDDLTQDPLNASLVESQRATILRETGRGRTPTIVLGGFVPDPFEQVFLLRRTLLASGDVYYVNYPRNHFSLEVLRAQLAALIKELNQKGQTPVVLGVSFGAGILIDCLRHLSSADQETKLAGLILVSPVGCLEDVISNPAEKPATLLGRALAPFLNPHRPLTDAVVEKSRLVFKRMFDAGVQNKKALGRLLSAAEISRIRTNVTACIRDISLTGSIERVRALTTMTPLTEQFSPFMAPLSNAPALVLFAENEDAVLETQSPTRFALEHATRAYLPNGRVEQVFSRISDQPVQHASLIFHAFDFLPHIQSLYREIRPAKLPVAA